MGKSDNKSQVLGDDPLAWLSAGSDTAKKSGKKSDKKKSVTKKTAVKKTSAKTKTKTKTKASKQAEPDKQVEADKPKSNQGKKLNQLVLESSMVINKAGDFYESLKKLDTSGQAIEIDASKVEIIDSAILQLLFAFALSLKEKNIKLSWKEPTENLLNKASILGLTEKLELSSS